MDSAVIVLPLEAPLRVAEDAAVLDVLSSGRVQLRLGSGCANTDAFSAFGIDAGKHQTRSAASLERLEQALSGTPLAPGASAAADARNTDDQNDDAQAAPLPLQPPAAGLRERLWHSHSSPEGARLAAAHGNGLLLGRAVHDPRGVQLPLAQAYLAAWRERADAASRAPRLGVVRAVFPAANRRTALAELADDVLRLIPWLAATGHPGVTKPAAILRLLNVHHGHPDEVIESQRADPALFPVASYFLPAVQSERSSLDQSPRRLPTPAETIAPALDWRPALRAT
ncbi:luciferase-like monooxygenase family protein [Burkholderia gladioli]|uniref:Luciferase-like monooxygenase family protein n=1 Tax=Burkholderia gladioli TaxID=28095 RepID=A0AAW3F772_BURGA|nr:LLM class flavin-dependent oxidoreductase [Burkholderia gladioli]KGC16877.1 luciferase-like monooxygenase family protein [Burkholderia gladioli]